MLAFSVTCSIYYKFHESSLFYLAHNCSKQIRNLSCVTQHHYEMIIFLKSDFMLPYTVHCIRNTKQFFPTSRKKDVLPVVPKKSCSGHVFQVDTEIGRKTRISLRVLFKLLFAPVAAEVILLVFEHTGEFRIIFINYHQTNRIGRHGWLPR